MRTFSKNKTIQEESIDVYCILEFQEVISTKTDVYAYSVVQKKQFKDYYLFSRIVHENALKTWARSICCFVILVKVEHFPFLLSN